MSKCVPNPLGKGVLCVPGEERVEGCFESLYCDLDIVRELADQLEEKRNNIASQLLNVSKQLCSIVEEINDMRCVEKRMFTLYKELKEEVDEIYWGYKDKTENNK